MAYQVKVERDSITERRERLTSFVIRMPRVVLAEVVTHRLVYESWGEDVYLCERTADRDTSKNSASSRAIPFKRMLQQVTDDPYVPAWSLQQKGMQGATMTDEAKIQKANWLWLDHLHDSAQCAEELYDLGIHKQDCNRLLEPWAWVTQIVTSSNWDNYFALRCHEAAFPPFRQLARMMYLARRRSTPRALGVGEWHLPFVSVEEERKFNWIPDVGAMRNYPDLAIGNIPDLLKFSAARCAWLSYENHEKEGTPEVMKAVFKKLIEDRPVHASPTEHQGTPLHVGVQATFPHVRSNLKGYLQLRKLIPHEVVHRFEPTEEEVASWGIE
jgi:thymidylate synthase ThyX